MNHSVDLLQSEVFFPGVWDWQAFWNLTAFLSIILAIMNILPIPALDGGHVLFLLFEVITGKKPSDKFLEYAQIAGMILLLGLVALCKWERCSETAEKIVFNSSFAYN